jgi:hypothetical protein
MDRRQFLTTAAAVAATAAATSQLATAIRAVAAMSGARFSDGFDRTAGSALAGSGPGWTGAGYQIDPTGTLAVRSATSGTAIVTLPVTTADQEAYADIRRGNGSSTGLVVRRDGATENYYGIRVNATGGLLLFKVVNGAVTNLATPTATLTDGQRLGIRAVGSTITALLDGVEIAKVTDTTLTAGRGIGLRCAGSTTRASYDNFTGGDVAPVVVVTDPFAQAPTPVESKGPNGTHWPADAPWLYSTTIPHVVEVDSTWAAIKAAANSFTAAQVDAGAAVDVRPGTLGGNGGSAGSTPAMQGVGSDQWDKRVLIRPRDGYGTVTLTQPARLHEVRGVCLALLTSNAGCTLTLTGCTNTAVAWSKLSAIRIVGQGGTNPTTGAVTGYPTTRCDCYEVVIPDVTVGDVDPAGSGSGYPGPAGRAGGNGWLHNCKAVGCYSAPQYLPVDQFDSNGNQTAGFGHNDGWQLYGSSHYFDFTFEDSAFWGCNNSALQIGGFGSATEAGAEAAEAEINAFYGLPSGTRHQFLTIKNCLLVEATTGAAVRYPRPAGTKPFTVTNCINGGGGYGRMDALGNSRFKGPIYNSSVWRVVEPTVKIHPGTTAKVLPGGGTWTTDPAFGSWTAADYDAACPVPTDTYLTSIWSRP